ncbi:Phosphatidylglycerophosphatase A [Candidatus Fokinia solitaria]|uniref:Phosphatidylglycerophosphatase A n=1 Tax=Candidatus Fokinia solitaria TaxID=1802984 RepID=A0A2U8BSM7_9RICK|nr:phosphatidylglycerophosphatase A [Candidatus Fokinia solitaria]AWD33342.1 Phosphatidylglycerophosphatase A [Candidatus Fokinia solitaria]
MKRVIFLTCKRIAYKAAIVLNTCFGVGYFPIASGTIGTLIGFPIYAIVRMNCDYWRIAVVLFEISVFIFIIGLLSITFWKNYGKIHNEKADASFIVIDEVLGITVCLSICSQDLIFLRTKFAIEIVDAYFAEFIPAFILFRIFDIAKPFPIRKIDANMHSAFGIMFDDVIAGIYAGLIVLMTRYCLELLF